MKKTLFKKITCVLFASSLFISCSKTSGGSSTPEEQGTQTFKVTWLNYDGTELEIDSTVSKGEMPAYNGATPTKPDNAEHYYTFDGWSPNIDAVVQDTTYTAKFLENNYIYHTVTFDTDGGSIINSQRIKEGEKISKPSDPIKDGYHFSGWTYDNNKWSFDDDAVNEDITLTANWEVNCYTVTWLNYDGTVLKVDEDVPYGTMPDYSGDTPIKPSSSDRTYSFSGWLPEITDVKQNATYIAVYSEDYIYHTVTFNSNGGSPIESQRVKHGDKIKRPEDPTKEGNHLVSWRYQNEDWSFAGYVVTEDMTLVADWGHNQYAINKIGGSGAGTSLVSYDENYCLGTSLKDGYTFTGWYSEAYCQGTKYTDESGNSINKYNLLQDLTLYAGFTYTVTFQTNGGSLLQPIILNENETIPSDVETIRDNSSFAGWYSDSKLVNEVNVNKPLPGSLTLYAKWDGETETRFFDYIINEDDCLTITNCVYFGSNLVIPKYIDGYLVSSIKSNAFVGCNYLSVFVPDSVTSIGFGTFQDCTSIVSITLPFVGGNATSDQPFGCVFGASSYSDNSSCVPTSLKQVSLGNNCSFIPDYAFYKCSSLTSITIPDSVTSIGYDAFSDCSSLTSITIPNSVTSISERAFLGCSSLTSITIPNSVTSISERAFFDCSSLTSIIIPDSVTSIGGYAFYNCSSLTSITLPFIGGNTIYNMYSNNKYFGYIFGASSYSYNRGYVPSSLKQVILSDICTSIPQNAFYNCSSLTSITIPNGVTSIGGSAFSGCSSLTSITIPFVGGDNTNNEFYNTNFNNKYLGYIFGASSYSYNSSYVPSSLKQVILGNSCTSIPKSAFYNCSSLTSITIPDSVTSIGSGAFYGCASLDYNEYDNGLYLGNENNPYLCFVKAKNASITSCEINDNCRIIVSGAFYNCSSLTSIIIPDTVVFIGASAFSGCSTMRSIVLPFIGASSTNNKYLGYFFGASSYSGHSSYVPSTLKQVILGNSCTFIPDDAFYGCSSLTSINIPDSVTSIGSYAFNKCSSLKTINISNNVASIPYQAFRDCTSLKSITIPNSVTSIGEYAFEGCTSLTSITIPDSVISIGSGAFSGCTSLTSITIPDSVISIESDAFSSCSSLIYSEYDNGLYLGNENNQYLFFIKAKNVSIISCEINNNCRIISNGAFRDCTSLKSITIPNSVTSIGEYAFERCTSLTSITIPDSVISIGSGAFSGCSSLTSIVIPNSVTFIGGYAFDDCSSITIYCEAESIPSGWSDYWNVDWRTVIWGYKGE